VRGIGIGIAGIKGEELKENSCFECEDRSKDGLVQSIGAPPGDVREISALGIRHNEASEACKIMSSD
jgi:hypothetical protein